MPSRAPSEKPVDDLTEVQAKAALKRLAAEIAEHDRRYYQEDAPSVSDAAYDALRRRNEAIERRFPALVRPDSPSRRVGAAPTGKFAKVRHRVPMLSLNNAFTDEPKIDGLSLSLRYEQRKLVNAATRGDGSEGEDVTANVRTLADVPHQLAGRQIPDVCEVRGEV